MRKTYLITAILLLSAVWLVAQSTPQTPGATQPGNPQATSPSSSPSQQPAAPDTTQSSQTSNDSSSSIEGCLNGSGGNFTLTDSSGKSWQLAGDTSKLSEHAGHQVRIMGSEAGKSGGDSGSSAASGGSSASAGSSTFTVKRVKMISSSCSTSK